MQTHQTENPSGIELREMYALRAALTNPDDCLELVLDQLSDYEFQSPLHTLIFNKLVACRNNFDMGMFFSSLDDQETRNEFAQWYASRSGDFWSSRSVQTYISALKETDELHTIGLKLGNLRNEIKRGLTVSELRQRLHELEGSLVADLTGQTPQRAGEGLAETINIIGDIWDRKEGSEGVCTNIKAFDRETRGLYPGRSYIIAARPGIGKTALGINITLNITNEKDQSVLFFSLEMGKDDIIHRSLSALMGQNVLDIPKKYERATKEKDLSRAANDFYRRKIYIDDSPYTRISTLRATVANQIAEHGRPSAVIIDYLQLLKSGDKHENRQVEVAHISRQLKLMAREFQIPMIILSQVNRGAEGAQPQLSDLRESGAIEQDADVVALLHSDRAVKSDKTRFLEVTLSIKKNRHGNIGWTILHFDRFAQKFFNDMKEAQAVPPPKQTPQTTTTIETEADWDEDPIAF